MPERQFIRFEDIERPLALEGAGGLLPMLRAILPGWRHAAAASGAEAAPFFEIRASDEPDRFLCRRLIGEAKPERRLDAVNAICDMVAAMPMALAADRHEFLCLHAAAVEIGGRLVVVPDTRRAGKSTLTACLARAGARVFSDDVVPVRFDGTGVLVGRASGILPRVRLPLPETLDRSVLEWSARVSGPENRQYRYLRVPDLPRSGEEAPLGAIVLLNRGETARAQLDPVTPDRVMDVLLYQNFTREIHSGDVLAVIGRMIETVPAYTLSYVEADDAAACLMRALGRWADPVARAPEHAGRRLARADLPLRETEFDSAARFVQRPGTIGRRIGGALYVSDRQGAALHRLNGVAEVIWAILAEPADAGEVAAIVGQAFPDAEAARVAGDVADCMRGFARKGLIDRHAG